MMMMIIIMMIVILLIIINGNLVLSFYCNIEISDTESHYTNKSHPQF
jgi:hypothetical protein